jgi:glutathione S-transferase
VAVKLHRCGLLWVKLGAHPCWRVQKALDEAGVAYEIVKEPLRRSAREETERRTGQRLLPWLELEDGTVVREESKVLAERIRAGLGRPGSSPSDAA